MKPMQQMANNVYDASQVIHLMLTEGEVKVVVREAEDVMGEIWFRATQVGPVLEDILHAPHHESNWEWNE